MIIGLGYKARSGKDTVAEYLWEHHGFKPTAFAYSLKQACMDIFGLTYDQMYGASKEIEDPYWQDTPRNILQKVGTECLRRGYSEDVWVKSLGKRIEKEKQANWIITDIRFSNEAIAVKQWGGILVKVNRPNAPNIATNQHASETSLEAFRGWDYILDNSSDLPQLYANIEIMMRELRDRNDK